MVFMPIHMEMGKGRGGNMLKIKIFFIILCLLFSVKAYSKCIPTFYEEYIYTYLEQLENNHLPIFYSGYELQKDKEEVFLIIEVGSYNGILIEKDDCTITNLAKVSYSNTHHQFVVEETHGGVYSYERVGKLLQNLLKQKFILGKSEDLRRLLRIKRK